MAQLKDSLVQGSMRVTDTLYANMIDTNILNADSLETNLLKINTSATDASSTTVGINLTNDDTINAHIGTSTSLGMYAAGNIIMRPGGATGNSTEGMILSTSALNPKDNTIALGGASNRWKSIYSTGYTYLYGTNQWCLDVYIYNKSKTQVGEIYYNSGNADNVTTGQYSFCQWSPKATPDTGTSGFHETYNLPAVTAGRTANAAYTIITTKNLSSITSVGTLTNTLSLKPASGEGGQLQLCASTANTTQAGITLDQLNSQLRIFGIASADGTTKTGVGTALVIDPYAKTITGGYTITGTLSGNATNVTGTVAVANGGTGVTSFTNDCAIVATGTTQTLVSRGLKITGSATENVTIQPNTSGKTLTIQTAGSAAMTIYSNSTLYFDRATGASIVYKQAGTEIARFNQNNNLQLNCIDSTQNNYKLIVGGNTAVTGTIAFTTAAAPTTEKLHMQYDTTTDILNFVFA